MNFQIKLLKKQITETESSIKNIDDRSTNLEKEIKITNEAKQLLEMLKTAKVKAKKDFILNVINTALNDIFQQDITIEIRSSDEDIKIQEKLKKLQIKYDIILLENGLEIGRNEKLLTSNGGGILSVISLLLKILTGYIYSKNKFYIFDESLAQVSEVYQERLSLFLKEFCDKYDFTIILVNHNPRLATHADMSYTLGADILKSGLKKLKIEQLIDARENVDSTNEYKFKIKNFQSIEDLEFNFSGFVSITGANNIGKSAVVRAINSLIFNTFHETFLRQNANESIIRIDHSEKWAELKYKSKKVFYSFWDGTELSGKKLAQDKIQEKMEEIGFKFLNVGKKYKNWKAELRDQVDRLYVTTQYDKMYLIGSKTNDSDKLFNFLFNAEAIAQALLNVNYDLRNLTVEQKENFEKRKSLVSELEILKKRLKIEEFYFQKSLVENFKSTADTIVQINLYIDKYKKIISKINIFDNAYKILTNFKQTNSDLQPLRTRVLRGTTIVNNLKNLIEKMKKYFNATTLLDYNKQIEKDISYIASESENVKNKIFKITIILEQLMVLQNAIDIKERYYNNADKISRGIAGREQLNQWWKNTVEYLGVSECQYCNGTGYHIKHTKGEHNAKCSADPRSNSN